MTLSGRHAGHCPMRAVASVQVIEDRLYVRIDDRINPEFWIALDISLADIEAMKKGELYERTAEAE